jgi:hypothetical protein
VTKNEDCRAWTGILIVTDCLNLVKTVRAKEVVNIPSWTAGETVLAIIEGIERQHGRIIVEHTSRTSLTTMHKLANKIRRQGGSYEENYLTALQQMDHELGIRG